MDVTSRQLVIGTLQPLVDQGSDVHIDLSRVTFADVAGVTALVSTAQRLPRGRRMVLERPPRQLRRIIELFWSDLKCIELVA
jgi:anti-anti-sigma regulatory factor